MELRDSNTNFGMAVRSPSKQSMPYFRRFLASANPSGKIDSQAFGEFIIKQSANEKVELCYKHTANGDVIHVFEIANPKNIVTVPCKSTGITETAQKGILQKVKDFFVTPKDNIEYEPVGDWNNLPEELKKAGEIADKMEKSLLK